MLVFHDHIQTYVNTTQHNCVAYDYVCPDNKKKNLIWTTLSEPKKNMEPFIEQIKNDLTKRVKIGEVIPMTVFNLAVDEVDESEKISVHQFELKANTKLEEKLKIIHDCILGVEWEIDQEGLKSVCSIYAESYKCKGDRLLYLRTKTAQEEKEEMHAFKNPTIHVNEKGELSTEFDEIVYICNKQEGDL